MSQSFFRSCLAAATFTLGLGATGWSQAADWPQHLGPTQDAVSTETGLLSSWPEAGPREAWRHDIGIGFAGVAVRDGKVFLNDREQGAADILRVFDLDTGKELWTFRYDAPGRVNFPGSRSTPCVTDTHVYMTGPMGHIHAVNRKTHKADWAYSIYDKYPDRNKTFGYAPSIVAVDDLLLISPTANGEPIVFAVKPRTGKVVWEAEAKLVNAHTHHTPVIRTIAGRRGITCRDRTSVYHIDIKTGKTIWSQDVYEIQGGPHVTIPPVTVFGDKGEYVFVTNGYQNGSVLLEVTAKPGNRRFGVREVYRLDEGGQVHPAILHDKHLYLNINENANLRGRNLKGGLMCFDAMTGEIKWKTKNEPNLNRGATLLVDGKLIAFDDNTGELILINPNPEKFEPISKFVALPPKGSSNNAWSPLVVADGRLVARDHQQIVCYDLRENNAN